MLDYKKEIATIAGWLTRAEANFLYQTAKKVQSPDRIVEIGSWKGKSAICLGKGVQDGNEATVFAIDPHIGSSEHHKMFGKVDTYEEFLHNINKAGVAKFIVPIRKTSEEASRNFNDSVGLLFIDGAHEYEFVKLDYDCWFSKVRPGGIIAFHDTWGFLGPKVLTAILLLTSSQIRNPELNDTITSFEKVVRNTWQNRIYNVLFLIFRTFFGWTGNIRMYFTGTVIK